MSIKRIQKRLINYLRKYDSSPSGLSCNLNNQKGQGLVEFTLILMFFLITLMGAADLIRIGYHLMSMQYAVSEAMRVGSMTPENRVDVIKIVAQQRARNLFIEVGKENITPKLVTANGVQENLAGQAGDWMIVEARWDVPMILKFVRDHVTLTASTLGKNER